MNITFDELRSIKHALPTGSVKRIADELNIDEQQVRNYFGANRYTHDDTSDWHWEPGPDGGIVSIKDTTILELAKKILEENEASVAE